MARRLFGTTIARAMWITKKPTIAAIQAKWT